MRYSARQLAKAGGLSGSYGGITISTNKNAGSLDTLHFLYDETGGFSALLKMYDHNPTVTLAQRDFAKTGVWTLRAPMLALMDPDPALEFPAGTVLQPTLLIRNTTSAPANASLSFEWKNSMATGSAVGPALHLSPHQTQEVDVASLQSNGVLPIDANWAEVKLTTTGKPGDIMAIASSYDKTVKYGAQTSFSDQLAFHWVGSVWEYDSTHDSIISVGNGGTKPAEAAFTLNYDHGKGVYEVDQLLQPDQQMWIDVGQLIRNQVPDKNGVVLPAALSMGSYEIRQLGHRGPGTLFEGKVVYDKKYGSVTYGCGACCGYRAEFEFDFNPLPIPIDDEEDQGVEGFDVCTAQWVDLTGDFDNSWSTANHSIATVNAYGVHKGVAIGSTTTAASAEEQVWNVREDCPVEPVYPGGNDNVNPSVSFSGPSNVALGQTATFTATVNPSDNSTAISLSISGGASIVSPTGTFTSSTSVVVKGVTAGSVTLTATITNPDGGGKETIGQTSLNVYAPVPTSLQVLSSQVIAMSYGTQPGGPTCSTNSYGIVIAIDYQVLDQNNNAIASSSMEPQEEILNDVTNGQNMGNPIPNWTDIGGTSTYPGTSKFTNGSGQFLDAPLGACSNSSGFVSTDDQEISVLLNGTRYSVRSNSWDISSSAPGHGSATNGVDISQSR